MELKKNQWGTKRTSVSLRSSNWGDTGDKEKGNVEWNDRWVRSLIIIQYNKC